MFNITVRDSVQPETGGCVRLVLNWEVSDGRSYRNSLLQCTTKCVKMIGLPLFWKLKQKPLKRESKRSKRKIFNQEMVLVLIIFFMLKLGLKSLYTHIWQRQPLSCLVFMLCVIVKVYCHASAGMRCSIASRVQHAEVYCVVLKDSALIGGKQPHDMSEWVEPHRKVKGCGWGYTGLHTAVTE